MTLTAILWILHNYKLMIYGWKITRSSNSFATSFFFFFQIIFLWYFLNLYFYLFKLNSFDLNRPSIFFIQKFFSYGIKHKFRIQAFVLEITTIIIICLRFSSFSIIKLHRWYKCEIFPLCVQVRVRFFINLSLDFDMWFLYLS